MKQNNKNYLFFNFNPVIENKIINKSDLTIESVYNITLENNIIEPVHDFTDIFELIIDKQNLESFYDENKDILNQLTDIKFYEFIYDKNYYERVFVLTQNYKLYEIDKSLNIIVDLNIKFSSEPKTFIRDNKIYFLSKNDILLNNLNIFSNKNKATGMTMIFPIKQIIKLKTGFISKAAANKMPPLNSKIGIIEIIKTMISLINGTLEIPANNPAKN